jgi:GMP synthase-like glutamine amidotransferase
MSATGKTILAIQNDPTDPPHLAGRWLMELGFSIKILRAYEGEEIPIRVPDGIDALMPLGGHMGAMDDHIAPWLPAERALLKDAVDRDIPVFAICLGAQLLAAANGGEVSRASTSEIGIYEITSAQQSPPDPLFSFDGSRPVAQWHEDYVSRLPEGATLLASSELCTNQVFRIGSKSYGVQFHPEVDSTIVNLWEEHADHAFVESGKSGITEEVAAVESQLFETWKPIVQGWGRLIS